MSLNFNDLTPIEQNAVIYLCNRNLITSNCQALTLAKAYKSKAKQFSYKYFSIDRSLTKTYSRDALLGLTSETSPDATDSDYIALLNNQNKYLSLFEAVNFAINLNRSKKYFYRFTDPSLGTSITMGRGYLVQLFTLATQNPDLCLEPVN